MLRIRTWRAARRDFALALTSCACVAACSGGGGGGGAPSASVGSLVIDDVTGLRFFVDAHHGGQASSVHLLDVAWGRLVDLYDFQPATGESSLIARDLVIDPTAVSDGVTQRFDTNPFLERETLTLLAPLGSPEFNAWLAELESNVATVIDKGFSPSELPPYTAVPRNAVLVLTFDDLLDDGGRPGEPTYPGRVSGQTVRLTTGYPPVEAFEARVFPDPCHGDLLDGRYHTTRLIIDPSISTSEALSTNLDINVLGLPAAISVAQPNLLVRVATRIASQAQQFEVLTNLAGQALAFAGNGPTDPTSETLDVVRAMRSGGNTSVTGDLDNGFLADHIAPEVLLVQPVEVVAVDVVLTPPAGAPQAEFALDVEFATTACAFAPRRTDVLELSTGLLEVVADYAGSTSGGVLSELYVRRVGASSALVVPGQGEVKTRWSAALGLLPECALRFSPQPSSPPATGVGLDSDLVLTFSEPLDPASVGALDGFEVRYDAPLIANALYERVVGRVTASLDRRRFTFEPSMPLRHAAGEATGYGVHLGAVTDLAGNAATNALPPLHFTLAPNAPALDSGSVALSFHESDEDGDGAPELRGQFLYDFARGVIRPRPVSRFSAVVDSSVPLVGAMASPAPPRPIQTPLSNPGSRAMLIWRYCDFGFSLLDEATHNLDLEGLHWQPFSGQTLVDHFSQFQMAAAHAAFAPDEATALGLPMFPDSGLVPTFDDNLLDQIEDPLTVLHPMARGFSIDPSATFVTATGTTMAPWPLNGGSGQASYSYWTWRDTATLAVGAPNGSGVDPLRQQQVTKIANVAFYPVNKVPTIGLPLLLDFRTKPDVGASGQNGFRIAIALGSSANPFFRSFSTGYSPCSGPAQDVDPDTETIARGGYDPFACATTKPQDNAVYFAQADFVVRVSRAHTIWLDTLAASTFAPALVEPGLDAAPQGAQVVLAYRGATAIQTTAPNGWHDATNYDAYGDSYTALQLPVFGKQATLAFTPTFLGNKTWKSTPTAIQGARFVQVRVSFLGNPATGLAPELSSLGLAFRR